MIGFIKEFGKGLFIDLHGHRHPIERIELGYLVSGMELRLDPEFLNDGYINEFSSIRNLLESKKSYLSFADLIMGDLSFGSLLTSKDQMCVPDNKRLYPEENEPYFSGGYNTMRHGSLAGGTIDGIQIEIDLVTRSDEKKRIKIESLISVFLLKKTYFSNMFLKFSK